MKQKIKNAIKLLRLAVPVRKSEVKDRQIDGFFKEMTDLGLDVKDWGSDTVSYREVRYDDKDQGFKFSVTVKQDSNSTEDEIKIDAEFVEYDDE
jgi:hypothetical protein